MEMAAISAKYSIEDATLKAIDADIDIILICHSMEKQVKALETVLKKVIDIKIPMKRMDASSERITKVRNRYILPYKPVDIDQVDQIVGCPEHHEIADKITSA